MNTGVGDAIDISWKLAAVLQGWGGPGLLASYEAERRPVGAQNIAASGQGTSGRATWRAAWRPGIDQDTPQARADLARLLDIAKVEAPRTFRVLGAELGYRYANSPICCEEPGGPGPDHARYLPTSWPGARLPHVWVDPGRLSVHDLISNQRFTLLCLTPPAAAGSSAVSAFAGAFRSRGIPIDVVTVDGEAARQVARQVYDYPYLLLRPDLHVAWRGRDLPAADDIAARVSGASAPGG